MVKDGKRVKRELPVTLTHDELVTFGQRLSEEVLRHQGLDDERKQVAKEFRDQMKGAEDEIRYLGRAIKTGVEHRTVSCQYCIEGSVVTLTRLDTGEVIETRPATEEEMQSDLFPVASDSSGD